MASVKSKWLLGFLWSYSPGLVIISHVAPRPCFDIKTLYSDIGITIIKRTVSPLSYLDARNLCTSRTASLFWSGPNSFPSVWATYSHYKTIEISILNYPHVKFSKVKFNLSFCVLSRPDKTDSCPPMMSDTQVRISLKNWNLKLHSGSHDKWGLLAVSNGFQDKWGVCQLFRMESCSKALEQDIDQQKNWYLPI